MKINKNFQLYFHIWSLQHDVCIGWWEWALSLLNNERIEREKNSIQKLDFLSNIKVFQYFRHKTIAPKVKIWYFSMPNWNIYNNIQERILFQEYYKNVLFKVEAYDNMILDCSRRVVKKAYCCDEMSWFWESWDSGTLLVLWWNHCEEAQVGY